MEKKKREKSHKVRKCSGQREWKDLVKFLRFSVAAPKRICLNNKNQNPKEETNLRTKDESKLDLL